MRKRGYPLNASLSPNTDAQDVKIAGRMLLMPWKWKRGVFSTRAENLLTARTGGTPYMFGSGRSAFTALLCAMEIGPGDEVIIQAFTCMVVPSAILYAGARPVYADIDASLNIDPEDLERKISKRTKAIVVQHTFGVPADMDAIRGIARKHGVALIEDCAHALGASYRGKPVGSLADAAFFSFGRDKIVSSVSGGAAVIHGNAVAERRLSVIHEGTPYPGMFAIFRDLFHPVAFSVILPLYNTGIGKALLFALQRLGLLSLPVTSDEKAAMQPKHYTCRYPDSLAALLVHQLEKLDTMIRTRRHAVEFMRSRLPDGMEATASRPGAVFLRFPVLTDDPSAARAAARKHNLLLGTWYANIVDPKGSDLQKAGYEYGMCPKAESYSKRILNIPTYNTMEESNSIIKALNTIYVQ